MPFAKLQQLRRETREKLLLHFILRKVIIRTNFTDNVALGVKNLETRY